MKREKVGQEVEQAGSPLGQGPAGRGRAWTHTCW